MQHESERNPAGGVNERERPCSAPATLQARATLFRATVASGLLVGPPRVARNAILFQVVSRYPG